MKMKRPLFRAPAALLLALLLLLPLAGCTGGQEGGEETTVPESGETPETPSAVIRVEDLAQYTIVRPDVCSDLVKQATSTLTNAFAEKIVKLSPKTDFYREGTPMFSIGEYEILIGATNRPESVEFLSSIRKNDFGYRIIGKKIVIAGGSDEKTQVAVQRFISDIVNAAPAEGTFISAEQNLVMLVNYPINRLTLGGTTLGQFRIVYPATSTSMLHAAEALSAGITEASGWVLPVSTDKAQPADGRPEIRLGLTDRDASAPAQVGTGEFWLGGDGTNYRIFGADAGAVLAGVRDFLSLIAGKTAEEIDLDVTPRKGTYDAASLTAMSFNVLVSNQTAERDARVLKMVTTYLPDTVGFQEASPEWMAKLQQGLSSTYAWVGEGRDGGSKGEYNPIFYKKDKFKLLDSGTRWLSVTPETVSKYETSSLNRIWTYALLERKSDGAVIMVVNTHFDHVSEEARDQQAQALSLFIGKCLDRSYPVVLTGDFNTTSDKPCYKTVNSSGVTDASNVSEKATRANTYTNYGAAGRVIDFVFVTPDRVSVRNYKVCNEKIDGNWPSDHHPVLIEYALIK